MHLQKKLFLILLSLLLLGGCAALFTEQEYVLINQPVTEKAVFYGMIYSMPEKANVRKIKLLGYGKIQNIEIYVRDKRNRWEPKKKVHGGISFPYEIILIAETDAIKIIKPSTTGTGHIDTVQFYTIADRKEQNE
ncbi:MAG: hypothetical protein OXI67_03280 [Candidatus Poribacteria bacterium]|nr:hypothetical protein [Candidatus Poribacteria bacterium]